MGKFENLIPTWWLRPGVEERVPVVFSLALSLWKWPSGTPQAFTLLLRCGLPVTVLNFLNDYLALFSRWVVHLSVIYILKYVFMISNIYNNYVSIYNNKVIVYIRYHKNIFKNISN